MSDGERLSQLCIQAESVPFAFLRGVATYQETGLLAVGPDDLISLGTLVPLNHVELNRITFFE